MQKKWKGKGEIITEVKSSLKYIIFIVLIVFFLYIYQSQIFYSALKDKFSVLTLKC